MNSLYNWVVFGAACACMAPLLCRLTLLHLREHRADVCMMHLGLSLGVAWAGYSGWVVQADMGHVGVILAAACWIIVSLATWRHGVPEHYKRHA